MTTIVVRFSSLGDVLLTAAVTGALAPVVYVTRDRYAGLVARFPGVSRVAGLREGEGIAAFARRLPPADRVVDLHGSPRSRLLCTLLRLPVSRVRKRSMRRRLRVAFKLAPPPDTVVERYARAAGVGPAPPPWLARPGAERTALVLVPCARHATKRWPIERFAELASSWDGPVVAIGGPGEATEMSPLAAEGVEVVAGRGFDGALRALGRAAVAVGADTGLLHLARACGVPVVGIFGPTTSRDGFWGGDRAVELALACRPCSTFGGAECPIGDHLCMEGLPAAQVRRAIAEISGR